MTIKISAITTAKILAINNTLAVNESQTFLAAVATARWSCDHSLMASLLALNVPSVLRPGRLIFAAGFAA